MSHLIIGHGEIGKSLHRVLGDHYVVQAADRGSTISSNFIIDVMHICFPFSEEFISEVRRYQGLFTPQFTVIHSTVPVGTCTQLNAVHSPVLGIHPHLESGIRTFPKYLGGPQASEVADIFRRAGLTVHLFDKSETTELMKILDTTFYGVCIEYTKDVKRQCDKYGVPFEAWNIWTRNYNEGYVKLGHPEYVRPNLVPIMTEIKGHCVRPNLELLETKFTEFLKNA